MARMETRETIIHDYAEGVTQGFLNDLAAGHIAAPQTEGGLVRAWSAYVSRLGLGSATDEHPCAAASAAGA